MEMILWVMQRINPADVPSWKQLRQTQECFKTQCGGISMRKYISSVGNILYLNDIGKMVGPMTSLGIRQNS
jgi:hypothetical protein